MQSLWGAKTLFYQVGGTGGDAKWVNVDLEDIGREVEWETVLCLSLLSHWSTYASSACVSCSIHGFMYTHIGREVEWETV